MGSGASTPVTSANASSAKPASDGTTRESMTETWNSKLEKAVGKFTVTNLLGNMQMGFTDTERNENERCENRQKEIGTFVVAHIYYGYPTKAKKESLDPLSPLWIEVDMDKLEKMVDDQNEGGNTGQVIILDKKLMSTIPTCVSIDKDGHVKIIFAKSPTLTYELTYDHFYSAKLSAKSTKLTPYVPSSPELEFAGSHVLTLRFTLPFPPGITTKSEIQYIDATKFTPKGMKPSKTELDNTDAKDGFTTFTKKPREVDWSYAGVLPYESKHIDVFSWEDLRPGKSFYFRVRFWTHEGYTGWSESSVMCSTLAGPPSQPMAPVVVVAMCTCMQVRWSKANANGSPITAYVLRGKAVEDDSYNDLYHGPLTAHLVMSLMPDVTYTYQVAAMNAIGISEFSEAGSGKTPAVLKVRSAESLEMKAALECREAWTEVWDPQSEQYFFYNNITGTRQLERPMALRARVAKPADGEDKEDEEKNEEDNHEDEKKGKEMSFRKKRFRLITAVHRVSEQFKQKQPGRGSVSSQHASPEQRMQQSREAFVVELRRPLLLADGYRSIFKAPLIQIYNRLKVEFVGEEGIDSGGLGKEAFLLLAKDSSIMAGPNFKNWLVLHKASDTSSGVALSGGLFFTEQAPEKKDAKGQRVPPPPPGGPKGGTKAPSIAKQMSNMRKSASNLLRGDFTVNDRQKSFKMVSPHGGSIGASNMLAEPLGKGKKKPGEHEAGGGSKTDGGPVHSVGKSLPVMEKEHKVTQETFFRFLGRFVGKALYDRQLIDLPLAPILFKHMVGDVAEDEKPPPPPVNRPTVLTLAPGHRGSTGSPAPGPPPARGPHSRHSTGGSPGVMGSPGNGGVVIPPPPRKPGSTPPPPSSHMTPTTSPAPTHREAGVSVMSPTQNAPETGLDAPEPGSEVAPESTILTDDDLAHFPDELCEHARLHVKKRLLQALVDVRSLDSQLYNSLVWMLNNDITNVIDETFTVVSTSTGETIPLCRDGETKDVTEDNKFEYVELMARWKTTYAVQTSLGPFLKGFHELIPLKELKHAEITAAELNLMLNGKPDIDVEELRPYVIFQSSDKDEWNEQNEIVLWLWQALREFDEEGRRGFLKFFTGSTRIPLDGFDPALNITQGVDMVEDSLPKAHTCFNQLVLPPYSSFAKLKERILFAVANSEGFELA